MTGVDERHGFKGGRGVGMANNLLVSVRNGNHLCGSYYPPCGTVNYPLWVGDRI